MLNASALFQRLTSGLIITKDNVGALEFGLLTESQVKEIQSIVGKYEL